MKFKFKRIIATMMLATSLIVGSVIPAFAAETNTTVETRAGEETWDSWGRHQIGYGMHVTNNNLTPVKTIGVNGNLGVWFSFSQADGYSSPVKVTMEIREAYTGRVLNEASYNAGEAIEATAYVDNITAGTKIQVFFDVSTADGYSRPGPYRQAYIDYGYVLF